MGAIFLLLSTGVVVFNSNCCCSENEKLSLYLSPETCHESESTHDFCLSADELITKEVNGQECCASLDKECSCSSPEMKYFKLVNHLINDEAEYVKLQDVHFILDNQNDFCLQLNVENQTEEERGFYTDPPPKIKSTLDFLIQIHQLKIPNAA